MNLGPKMAKIWVDEENMILAKKARKIPLESVKNENEEGDSNERPS